ncbi:MAG: hypothetical protein JWP94_1686 [Mucilaginibacter sp.]|nr:hypothetical protein [Mucilaginibacter sp.]
MATSNYPDPNPITYDLVPTYCLIKAVTISSGIAYIQFTAVNAGSITANPMVISAWQRLKNEYPRYAYPGFDNRVQTASNSVLAAVSAVVNAAKNLSELKKSFYQKANARQYASAVTIGKSFVKLVNTNGFKLGGPPRVTKIQISDTWNLSNPSATAVAYGQAYSYTTTDNGTMISSGVATYEPSIGNDENALKQPVPYVEKIKGAINNYFDLELPLGESFYPAATITYSKITVNDLDKTGSPSNKTGSIVNEFYTSRDYPVKVRALPIIPNTFKPPGYYSLTRSSSDDETCLSQGYSFEVNDMNGKQKAVTVYDMAGAIISGTAYYYNSQANGTALSLNNQVNVIDPATLLQASRVLGRDVDFFTDVREQETSNRGQAINLGGDIFPIPPWIPFFGLPHFPVNQNDDYKLFRSVCAVKVIQNYGILNKVVKTENGSSITTENLAYDALTGEALVTRTQNEFKKYIYSVNIPAYWVYKGMGAAYQNLGVLLSGFTTNTNGEITTSYTGYVQGGDEILDTNNGNHYWVIDNQAVSGGGTTKKLVDRNGFINANYNPAALVKIVKSGFHNMLTASTTTLASLNRPFTADNHLQLISSGDLTAMKVINASVTTYDENWTQDKLCPNPVVNTSYVFSFRAGDDGEYCGSGAIIKPDSLSAPVTSTAAVWQNSLNLRSGIWINQPSSTTLNESMGFDRCITITKAKDYFFGFAADNGIQIYIDGALADSLYRGSTSSFNYWHVNPHYLSTGKHTIHVEFVNVTAGASAGLEIYDNNAEELTNPSVSASDLKIIFSTASLLNSTFVQSFRTVSGAKVWHYTINGAEMQVSSPNVQQVANPYIQGFLGNWRPYQTKVFQQSRNYSYSASLPRQGVDVKNAGFVNSFYSYWYLNTGTSLLTVNPNGTRWVTANTVTLYDKYGQQLENRDALARYSAAKFDFNGELPSAVASNAMNREIYANSLEDSKFTPGTGSNTATCSLPEFTQLSTGYELKQLAVNTISHSGNYSALLPFDGVTLSTITDTLQQKNNAYLTLDGLKQYMTLNTTGLYPNGFEPYPNKKYIFDAWVNDAHPNDKSANLTLSVNGNNIPLKCKAVVENWKLVEGTIDLSTISLGLLNISITPNAGNTIYIDDIRIHPFDAQLKTYAYDDKTLRLMAEIDENGFATFYEYDDEGLLIRVKKETEKGIMTLKESRSTYRRKF